MVLLPWKTFQAQKQTLLFKIATNGAVQFMSWMKHCKVKIRNTQVGTLIM